MLHVLHDFFSFARRPAGPPNLHATYATRLFRLPSSPRRTPDFTCYKCYATFRCFPSSPAGPPLLHATCATRLFACSRSLGTAPHSTCYMCSLAFFDSSTLGREPPHSTCYLCYLPFFDCPGKGPHFPRYRGFGFSDSLVHAAYACLSLARVASKSTCLLLCTSRFNARRHHMVEPHQGNMWCLAAYTPQSLKRTTSDVVDALKQLDFPVPQ